MIADIELLRHVEWLFEKKIILYGAGNYGKKAYEFLKKAGIEISFFCDSYISDGSSACLVEHDIISTNGLRKFVQNNGTLIIITSVLYCDEISEILDNQEFSKSIVCSYYGMKYAIELNIDYQKLDTRFREEYKINKSIWKRNYFLAQRLEPAVLQLNRKPDILVYQPTKVGSSTIYVSLRQAGVDSVQIHTFCPDTNFVRIMGLESFFNKRYCQFVLDDLMYYKNYYQKRNEKVKIITMVREPIARDISEYFTYYCDDYILTDGVQADTYQGVEKLMMELAGIGSCGFQFEWFDRELRDFTGIDIFQYPFDREAGFSIIREGNMEILVLKMEAIDSNKEIIAEFIGNQTFNVISENLGSQKPNRYIYKELKRNLCVPCEVWERYYMNNQRMDHFYTEREKADFKKQYYIN